MALSSQLFYNWHRLQQLTNYSYRCGYCGDKGYRLERNLYQQQGGLFICPSCHGPTFLDFAGNRYSAAAFGNPVQHLPKELNSLHGEARSCSSQGCYTASVLLCRKALMNIAVEKDAKKGLNFIYYVEYLSDNGYTPPNGKHWVDHIRKKGNEATHEISVMTENDAKDLIRFVEMLLKFIYEFPASIPQPKDQNTPADEIKAH